ncbi:hypothetical protein Tco_0827397 [Tanacetum coccineum]
MNHGEHPDNLSKIGGGEILNNDDPFTLPRTDTCTECLYGKVDSWVWNLGGCSEESFLSHPLKGGPYAVNPLRVVIRHRKVVPMKLSRRGVVFLPTFDDMRFKTPLNKVKAANPDFLDPSSGRAVDRRLLEKSPDIPLVNLSRGYFLEDPQGAAKQAFIKMIREEVTRPTGEEMNRAIRGGNDCTRRAYDTDKSKTRATSFLVTGLVPAGVGQEYQKSNMQSVIGKQTNLGYIRLTKFFPSIDKKPPQKLPPIILKTPPFEGMINKAPLEGKQKVLKEFLDLRRSKMDEMMLQGPEEDEIQIMNVTFRSLPCHMTENSSSFLITPQAFKNMLHLFKSLGMPKLRIPLSSNGIDLYTRLGIGLLGLYAWDMVVLYGTWCLPGFMIEVPLLKVSDASSTASIASSSTSTSQIGSSSASTSQIGSNSASTSQLTNPDIGSTSEFRGSESLAHHLSEKSKVDKSIGFLLENIDYIYNDDKIVSGSPVISEKEFHAQQQLVLSGFYELSPFQIRFLNAKGMSDFINRGESHLFGVANDPYVDEESKSYMISSTAIKDELVLRGLARMIHQFTYYYSVEYERWVENLIIDYFQKIQLLGKSNRLYRLRIRPPLLGSAISRSRILEIVKLYIDEDSISFRLVKDFLYNHYQNEEGERCILNYIPDLGEITDALEDLIMTSMFEYAFRKKFPNICYYRFLNEVLINCTCEEDEITFNESAGYALLKEIKLPGDIVSIGPGDSPLPLYNDIYHLQIDRDKDVIAYRSR